jgi:hypothetical protein
MAVTDSNGNPVRDSSGNPVRSGSDASQKRNSKAPSKSLTSASGSETIGVGASILKNGVKQTIEDIASGGVGGIMSAIRGFGIPIDGLSNIFGGTNNATWARDDNNDWRMRLSIPVGMVLDDILQAQLNETQGMIFPYTPSIIFQHSAQYSMMKPTHSNYPFPIYQSSQPDALQISGEFYVESAAEGLYWAACVHYLRSVTKMAYGDTSNQGAPPPIVLLNGYGDYVFKNVPSIIQSMSVDLPPDVDYLYLPEINTYAPTRSTITVVAQPTYSRSEVHKFSLDTFIKGGYANGKGGFI